MRASRILLIALLLCTMRTLSASGPLGVYGIVEKAVFEPSERAPERVQLWGAFAYVDGMSSTTVSTAHRGYLYFRLPAVGDEFTQSQIDVIKNEWADLKSVVGTGQAVAFGRWGYIGGFGAIDPSTRSRTPPYILEHNPSNDLTDLRVRPATEPPAAPALYQTNTGVVKLTMSSHAAIVKLLQDALK